MNKAICLALAGVVILCGGWTAKASGALGANLDGVIVYPNPFRPALGHGAVTFDNLTADVRLRIYKLTGELVYDELLAAPAGTTAWSVVNEAGEPVASGLYLYLLTNNAGQKADGKIVVVR